MYIDPEARLEDNRSTAWSFTLVSAAGIILLILLDLGILPVAVADFQKVILTVVMGILFLIFLVIGIQSFLSMNKLKDMARKESSLDKEITEWFLKEYDAMAIQNALIMDEPADELEAYITPDAKDAKSDESGISEDGEAPEEPEALYYPRYRKMSALILAKYPGISEEFKDHIIEELYTRLFAD